VLCTWCWETVTVGEAIALLGDRVHVGAVDRAAALLARDFILRAWAECGT
jgi:hypothetical protein